MNSSPQIILLADDDSDDRLLVQDALAESGLQIELHCVGDGEEVLDYLNRRGKFQPPAAAPRPGLILLDLNMPRKDGRETLRDIKSVPDLRRIPVVVLTTSRSETEVGEIYDLGANSFIAKPVQFEALVGLIRSLGQYWFEAVELPVAAA